MIPIPRTRPTLKLDDIAWLVSPEGEARVSELLSLPAETPIHQVVTKILRGVKPERIGLVADTASMRRRGERKFRDAMRMFFTQRGLEQATGDALANYKASKFPRGAPLADLCCGIGGDLLALAGKGEVIGVESDPIVAALAAANAKALGKQCEVRCIPAEEFPVEKVAAWHIDPDRRPSGQRTTDLDCMQPNEAVVSQLLARNPNAAIKLAPASELPDDWSSHCQREWLGWNRECPQQVAWFGGLRTALGPRVATIVLPPSAEAEVRAESIGGTGSEPVPLADRLGKYVYEPVAPVLAAHLTGALAAREKCAAVAPGVAYLTSDELRDSRLTQAFAVVEELPFDRRKLKARIRELEFGPLEIKLRGVDESPEELRKKLMRTPAGPPGVVLLYRRREGVRAILAKRV